MTFQVISPNVKQLFSEYMIVSGDSLDDVIKRLRGEHGITTPENHLRRILDGTLIAGNGLFAQIYGALRIDQDKAENAIHTDREKRKHRKN